VIDSNLVFRVQNSLDGLKQAPIACYAKIDRFFLNFGLKHCEFDHNIYVSNDHGNMLIVVIYVDNLVITSNNIDLILRLKKQLADTFDMTNLVLLHYFLGLQVLPLSDGLFLYQSKYVLDLLTRFKMADYKMHATPFKFGVKLIKDCQSPKVDPNLY
jgi:hypothetical protein